MHYETSLKFTLYIKEWETLVTHLNVFGLSEVKSLITSKLVHNRNGIMYMHKKEHRAENKTDCIHTRTCNKSFPPNK